MGSEGGHAEKVGMTPSTNNQMMNRLLFLPLMTTLVACQPKVRTFCFLWA